MVIEWVKFGKPSLIGIVTGMVAGLATITPASGFVGPLGGFCFGLAGGLICFWAVGFVKTSWRIDDSLDVFAVHGVGGLAEGATMSSQLGAQAIGVVATVAWSLALTFIIVKVTTL